MKIYAEYNATNLPPSYIGFPLIEALPPILEPKRVLETLLRRTNIDVSAARLLPPHLRVHELGSVDRLFVPRIELVELESDISILLRNGYLGRDPRSSETIRKLASVRDLLLEQGGGTSPLPPCHTLVAASGMGKSRSILAILSLIPQVIVHKRYEGKSFRHVQLVWLSVKAPINGSINGLLHSIFSAIDQALGLTGKASYLQQMLESRTSIEQRIALLGVAAANYHLGLLHIDDVQRLQETTKSESGELGLNTIIQLANVVGVPLLFSGTNKMVRLLASSFEAGRRSTSNGTTTLSIPADAKDHHFRILLKGLMRDQLLENQMVVDDVVEEELFRLTQGIPAVLVLLFKTTMKSAIRSGASSLELKNFQTAYDKYLVVLNPALEALRCGQKNRLQHYEDLLPTQEQIMQYMADKEAETLKKAKKYMYPPSWSA